MAEEAGVTTKVKSAASTIKQKADERGVSEIASKAASSTKNMAVKAKDYTVESSKSIYQSAQDGTLKDKTS